MYTKGKDNYYVDVNNKIVENLDAKYAKSLKDIEDSLEKSETKIDKYLKDLGYISE